MENTEETIKEEAYATDTPLVKVFGDNPKTRIISAMLSEKEYDLNISDIARLSGSSRNAVYKHIEKLVYLDIIEKTRTTGNSQMYKINQENEIVKKIEELEGITLKQLLKKENEL